MDRDLVLMMKDFSCLGLDSCMGMATCKGLDSCNILATWVRSRLLVCGDGYLHRSRLLGVTAVVCCAHLYAIWGTAIIDVRVWAMTQQTSLTAMLPVYSNLGISNH